MGETDDETLGLIVKEVRGFRKESAAESDPRQNKQENRGG